MMTATSSKHTAGAAKVREFNTVFEVRTEDGVRLVTTSWHDNSPWYPTKDEARANVDLIAEAFTVAHETRLTPRQLAERCKELEAALERIAYSAHADTAPVLRGCAQGALAKAQEGGA
jgi:hypothetical protein